METYPRCERLTALTRLVAECITGMGSCTDLDLRHSFWNRGVRVRTIHSRFCLFRYRCGGRCVACFSHRSHVEDGPRSLCFREALMRHSANEGGVREGESP